ncbi:restin homolog isoform X3 [Chironomus tepperi]|uniref:restin homolog isoform X3 n=1 Tax=Chironomus tepperi TaxID=113505 RepID=UPI00391F2E11
MSESTNEIPEHVISQLPKPSGIKPPSSLFSAPKVSRICSNHDKKPDLPVAATPKKSELNSNDKMRRQSETHHLPDVSEESEYDLITERFGCGYEYRSSKSRSPDSFRFLKYSSPDRKSSNHGTDLTTDTDSFMIGQRVYVGGVKSGRITFIGEVHFAPGEWAGIVLDEPEGKNDGAVSGKRYFQCEPKKGIFSRLTRLTREPIGSVTDGLGSMDFSFRSVTSPLRTSSGNTSPTHSVISTSKHPAGSSLNPMIGDRVIVKNASGSRVGILRFRGETQFASGDWCGVEFEDATGKNDGSVNGVRYFTCQDGHGIFVPAAKVSISPLARKMRLSRQNSQESLTSNITLGSLASTTASKLRMNATQKRLSTLNKSPSATSTPKPSFSLQDILREKSNHIEQIMKERDIDREEMSAQTILYQKNLNQYKEKIAHLQKLLDEEKKKSEDLQFSIDEAQATSDEKELSETAESVLKKKIADLEGLKNSNLQAGGDYVDSSHAVEINQLRTDLEQVTRNLQISEGLKDVLQKQIQSLHEQVADMKVELELKSSADLASEEVLKNECNYLQTRINELENESEAKSKEIIALQDTMKTLEESRNEELTMIEKQMKERVANLTSNEESLMQKISEKDTEIAQLKDDIERLTSSDIGAQEIIKTKDIEIQKLIEKVTLQEGQIKELSSELVTKIDEVSNKEKELESLEKSFDNLKSNIEQSSSQCEQHIKDIEEKSALIMELTKQIDAQNSSIESLKSDITNLQKSVAESQELAAKSQDSEKTLTSTVADLSESKVKLENDLTAKDNELKDREENIQKLTKELDEIKNNLTGLSSEAESRMKFIQEKDSIIEKLTKDFDDLKTRSQGEVSQLEDAKKALESKLEESLISANENVQKINEIHTSEVAKLSASIEELKKLDKEKDARIEVMEKNIGLLDETKQKLEKNLADLEAKYAESSAKLTKVEREDSEKASQLEKLQITYNDIQKKLQEAELTVKKTQEDKNTAEIDNKDLNRKLGAQEEKVAQLNEQKLKLEQELEKLKSSSLDANSELKNMSDELKEKHKAFEAYRTEADKKNFELQKTIDQLENQRELANQSNIKLKNELAELNQQKIENENQLNLELQSIKATNDGETSNLQKEITQLRGIFENEKAQLRREKQEAVEASEKLKNELEAKIKGLKETLDESQKNLEESKLSIKQSESRLSFAIDELKGKEAELAEELAKERQSSDELKAKFEELEASKKILRDEYESKLHLEKSRITNLEGELQAQKELFNAASTGNAEKIKFLDEIQQKNIQYEQKVSQLSNQIQNEMSSKKKLEESIEELKQKLQEVQEEQVDLVTRKEEYKNKAAMLEEQISDLRQRRASLDEKLKIEKKESEILKTESDTKIFDMQEKLNELNQSIAKKDYEKEEVVKRLQQREDDIKILNEQIKEEKNKLLDEIDSIQRQVKSKEDEITKMANECASKDELLADLRNNMENLKSCLNTVNVEKTSSTNIIEELNNTISARDYTVSELNMKIQQIEASLADKDDQLKNVYSLKTRIETESKMKIDDLMEQINILEDVKHQEVGEMAAKLSMIESQMSIYRTESVMSKDNEKINQELLLRIKDLEMSETEMQIENQKLKRQLDEIQSNASVPVPKVEGAAGDQDLIEHIEFLNSIIADMHKKNLKLSKQIETFGTGSSKSAHSSFSNNDMDLKFLEKLEKKKPPPRMYCDICEEFDHHETEDCPTQCSKVDLDAPAVRKEEKQRKLPPPRKYCDFCEIFDAHETEECPNNDETF